MRVAVLACALMALWPAASAFANIYTVTEGIADNVDNTPDDGICGSGAFCSLRQAVQTANGAGAPGFDTIEVPPNTAFGGVFTLTRPNPGGVDEDAAVDGDIDITTHMEIKGIGATPTISGDTVPVDRIFEIPSGNPTVTLTNLKLTKGQAPSGAHGGGIKHESGSLAIANTSITDNEAPGAGAKGGGIYSAGAASLTLTDTRVNANDVARLDANGQGGGIWAGTPATLTRVSVDGNFASFGCGTSSLCSGYGAGIWMGAGTLTNVTISGNYAYAQNTGAAAGGGLLVAASTANPLTVVNSTIADNIAAGEVGLGGGNIDSGDGLRLESTIVDNGQTPDRAGTENCANDTGSPTAFTSLGHNLEARIGQGASQCGLSPGVNGDMTSMDAGVDMLAFNGGPTPTQALMPGSPAINAGALTGPATDQRGVPRPQGAGCDIGAFELEQTGTIPGSTCAGPPAPPVLTPTLPPANTPPSPGQSAKRCKKGQKLKKGKCVKKKKKRR